MAVASSPRVDSGRFYWALRGGASQPGELIHKGPGNTGAFPGSYEKLMSADRGGEIGAAFGHRQHDHPGADVDAGIEIGDVLIGEADAAGRDMRADRLRRVGAVNAIDGAAEIHRARAERVAGAAGHVARQIG